MKQLTWRSIQAAQVELTPELHGAAVYHSLTDVRFVGAGVTCFDTVWDVKRLQDYEAQHRESGRPELADQLKTLQQILIDAALLGYQIVQFVRRS